MFHPVLLFQAVLNILFWNQLVILHHVQGSPKCGIVGGDKIEVEGEIGASREGPGACSPRENFENLQHLKLLILHFQSTLVDKRNLN